MQPCVRSEPPREGGEIFVVEPGARTVSIVRSLLKSVDSG